MNHEAVREHLPEALPLLSSPRVLTLSLSDGENMLLHNFFSENVRTKHTHTLTHLSPPTTINNHDSGSLFSWWIRYWLYGLLLHLQGADMVGFLRLEGVRWGGWIDLRIDNSLCVSVGGCFMGAGGQGAEVGEERSLHVLEKFYLSEDDDERFFGVEK